MSPRPRTVDDSTILEAAVTVLGRIGPERLTLADVGTEAGLSAATLVQRFGSKRDLMLSVLRFAKDGFETRLQTAIDDNDSPLEAIFAAAMNRPGSLQEPEVVSNMFAFYLSEMRDPQFRELARENANNAVTGFKSLLEEAIAKGEIADNSIDTAQLAETIYSLTLGTLMRWSVYGEGCYREMIRKELDTLLRPFRSTEVGV
jgi:AcrR family transcriptional regulator